MIAMTQDMTSDERQFAAAAERHRRELHVHCYRMLGSFDEAEDALRETLLRAWRARETRPSVRPRTSAPTNSGCWPASSPRTKRTIPPRPPR